MFSTVLVANRGEIAVRIIRTCRELGVRAVAVYSEADAATPHVALADEAIPIGPAEPARSYLDGARLIDAARRAGAEAVHPGYGFLAEDAGFARACADAGLVFIGPPAEVIARFGDKTAARRLATEAGVPVVPGVEEAPDDGALWDAAARLGFPLLVKAAAGGGGRGMRVVHRPDDLPAAVAAARREARAAFGSDAVFLERLLERWRHVEVQVLADAHGGVVHLGERECSVQRRYQKVVEEAPSPAVDPPLREALGEAAVRLARAAGYVNAGTIEFLVDGRTFFFLEANTRLQVEHPVTELVAGVDLVAAQLRIAAGEPLAWRQEDLAPRGWAIEARVYAEDPEAEFAPSPGRVLHLAEPHLPGVRIDSGVAAGVEIPPFYDPLLAKLIAWGTDREHARRRLERALAEYVILGPRTNVSFLRAVVGHPAFAAGALTTGFLAEEFAGWRRPEPPEAVVAVAAVLAAVHETPPAPPGRGVRPGPTCADPWAYLTGWRLG
ncbi:MAG: biotin carboxylase N-terminal domain-containing protein [Armatimonadota bacterium]|nr:biotin carboxylase N-terminal domain-containing protein [Armatimonadota bacterium]MDR7533273.1 biotin carboxylase N-terminal domain-containing protein [Armatimonadota bacterium]